MKYLVWIIRIIIFVLVLLFAINNTHLIDVNFFADLRAKGVPLVLVLLIAFVLGSVFSYFLMAPSYFRGKFQQAKLKDEIAGLHRQAASNVREKVQEEHSSKAAGANSPDIFIALQPHNKS
ncbi:MAG: lipopolysaccharide assembly protein LapA domain-containing protein [Alcaligenaceae bacterium]|nr:lipopolysaccharide assembly protein LapA domain-containing protein [Alcaligenaceae bacterium]